MASSVRLRKLWNREKGQCTWCGERVTPPRSTWCSQDCVERYREQHDWSYIRRQVEKRDQGVCCLCGTDCIRMVELVHSVRRREGYGVVEWLVGELVRLGWNRDWVSDFWQADHIVPRIRGGGNELSNLRTLCIPCHKRETAELARLRAAEPLGDEYQLWCELNPCPTCHGTGDLDDCDDDYQDGGYYTCPTCNGCGIDPAAEYQSDLGGSVVL